jgi:hypothetical protein
VTQNPVAGFVCSHGRRRLYCGLRQPPRLQEPIRAHLAKAHSRSSSMRRVRHPPLARSRVPCCPKQVRFPSPGRAPSSQDTGVPGLAQPVHGNAAAPVIDFEMPSICGSSFAEQLARVIGLGASLHPSSEPVGRLAPAAGERACRGAAGCGRRLGSTRCYSSWPSDPRHYPGRGLFMSRLRRARQLAEKRQARDTFGIRISCRRSHA